MNLVPHMPLIFPESCQVFCGDKRKSKIYLSDFIFILMIIDTASN